MGLAALGPTSPTRPVIRDRRCRSAHFFSVRPFGFHYSSVLSIVSGPKGASRMGAVSAATDPPCRHGLLHRPPCSATDRWRRAFRLVVAKNAGAVVLAGQAFPCGAARHPLVERRDMFPRLRSFVTTLVFRDRFEDSLDEEVRFHLDAQTEDLVRSGVPSAEAADRAREWFGSVVAMNRRLSPRPRWSLHLAWPFRPRRRRELSGAISARTAGGSHRRSTAGRPQRRP